MIFRYPGSKSKYIEKILEPRMNALEKAEFFHDVFVGGGSSFLFVNQMFPNKKIILNDLNENIYNFWNCVKDENLDFIISECNKKATIERFIQLREQLPTTPEQKAFNALFFNRTTFSGIDKAGPIGGYKQDGKYKIDCRFNSFNISKEIRQLSKALKGKIEVTNLSFKEYLSKFDTGFFYLDPPYFKEGAGLYSVAMSDKEHQALFEILKEKHNWVLSYDNHPIILEWYADFRIVPINVKYSVVNNSASTREIAVYSK